MKAAMLPIPPAYNPIARIEQRIVWLTARADQASGVRLLIFVGGLIVTFSAYFTPLALFGFISVGLTWIIAFAWAARIHRRWLKAATDLRTWRAILLDHQARHAIHWPQLPPPFVQNALQAEPAQAESLAAMLIGDLDLAGTESLHQLLDTAVTRGGASLLLQWLTVGTLTNTERLTQRQIAVEALAARPQFQRKLSLHARNAAGIAWFQQPTAARWNADALRAWATRDHPADALPLARLVPLLSLWSAVTIILFVLAQTAGIAPLYIGSGLAFFAVNFYLITRIGEPFTESLNIRETLEGIGAVFAFLERQPPPAQVQLYSTAGVPGGTFSGQLRRLTRITALAGLRGNPLFAFALNAILPFDLLLAWLLGRERRGLGEQLPAWLDSWHSLEALCSLATWRTLHLDNTIAPIFVADPIVRAEQVRHPLIGDQAVPNSVHITQGDLILITGSNMAGKSTFLRTLGVNLILAYAGAHVPAARFETGTWRLFTCIRVADSVTDGFSYFYAEVRRLKALLDALDYPDAPPLIYLIDEIFRGTNNQERYLGSRAYINALAAGHGAGALSTHDLELVNMARDHANIRNMHFREEVRDGLMTFDYALREGPSPTTNALIIMRAAGLPVPE